MDSLEPLSQIFRWPQKACSAIAESFLKALCNRFVTNTKTKWTRITFMIFFNEGSTFVRNSTIYSAKNKTITQ